MRSNSKELGHFCLESLNDMDFPNVSNNPDLIQRDLRTRLHTPILREPPARAALFAARRTSSSREGGGNAFARFGNGVRRATLRVA